MTLCLKRQCPQATGHVEVGQSCSHVQLKWAERPAVSWRELLGPSAPVLWWSCAEGRLEAGPGGAGTVV